MANTVFKSTCILNNYTDTLFSKNTLAKTITCGTLEISEGSIKGIVDPSDQTTEGSYLRGVSKSYVDSSVNNISDPYNSIQRSSGTNFLGSKGLVYSEGIGLVVSDSIMFGNSGSIYPGGIINNSAKATDESSGVTRSYLFSGNLKAVKSVTSLPSNNLTVSDVMNTAFTRESSATGVIQDILPSPTLVIEQISGPKIGSSFDFYYRYVGSEPFIFLYGPIVIQGNFLTYNTPVDVCTVPTGSIYKFKAVVTSLDPALVVYYAVNNQAFEGSNQQIDRKGLKTDIFRHSLNSLNNTLLVFPVVRTIIDEAGPVTYSASAVKGLFITRSGLTSNTTDSMPLSIVDQFELGSGLTEFSVQNVSDYSLTVGEGTEAGYSYGPGTRTVPSKHIGTFKLYINKETSECVLYSVGIGSMNG
jgi:hypothetical protein